LVDRRTLTFVTLAVLVWAALTSSLTGYFYLQNVTRSEQLSENQQCLDEMATVYDESMAKYNNLLSEYSALYGNYSFPVNTNFTLLTHSFGKLLSKLKGSYSHLLMNQWDMNRTYHALSEKCQTISYKQNVTREEFGELLSEYHELFHLLLIRELSRIVTEAVTLTVSICIDYGNETVEWFNETSMPPGSTLLQLTHEIAAINYTYYPGMKPGHILLTSINYKEEYSIGYYEGWNWIWCQWNDEEQTWFSGPVGCDAWMLNDGGIYKWSFEHWLWS
jgi:hypothetical protein